MKERDQGKLDFFFFPPCSYFLSDIHSTNAVMKQIQASEEKSKWRKTIN